MKRSFKLLLPLLLLFAVSSCKKSTTTTDTPVVVPDTSVPVISLTDPTAGKSYVLGTVLHLQMDLSDNVELKSYKVVIAKSLKGVSTSDWAYTNTWNITPGKKTMAVNHNEIIVPLTGAGGNQITIGNYDVTITCLDTSNNEASKTFLIALAK